MSWLTNEPMNSLVMTLLDAGGPRFLFFTTSSLTSYSWPGPKPDCSKVVSGRARELRISSSSSFCQNQNTSHEPLQSRSLGMKCKWHIMAPWVASGVDKELCLIEQIPVALFVKGFHEHLNIVTFAMLCIELRELSGKTNSFNCWLS